MDRKKLELELNNFNRKIRFDALNKLELEFTKGNIQTQTARNWVNLHCHSFFSYNGYGMSPSALVWKAKLLGLDMIGLVDFDTLDGIDEFHQAGKILNIKTIASMETRVYLPNYLDHEINSPGEPGIAYHMISGLISSSISNKQDRLFSSDLLKKSDIRNKSIVSRMNKILPEIELEYDLDVLSLTPNNNPTERHICEAYRIKAEKIFPDSDIRFNYWSNAAECNDIVFKNVIHNKVLLEAAIRKYFMKQGGVAYQQPTPDNFPKLVDLNNHALKLNGIPVMAWVDGMSPAENNIKELIEYHISQGTKALNIIPDRNYNIKDKPLKKKKVKKLYEIVEIAEMYDLPIMVGTEINAPGLKFVDDFNSPELLPLLPIFRKGAEIFYGHTLEQLKNGNGYCSEWSNERFSTLEEKNKYYMKIANSKDYK